MRATVTKVTQVKDWVITVSELKRFTAAVEQAGFADDTAVFFEPMNIRYAYMHEDQGMVMIVRHTEEVEEVPNVRAQTQDQGHG